MTILKNTTQAWGLNIAMAKIIKDADRFVVERQQSSQKAQKKQEPRGGQTTEALIEFIETWCPPLVI